MKNEVTIDVNARLNVTRDVAEACLALVAVYMNETGGHIVMNVGDDGRVKLKFDYVMQNEVMPGV